MIKARLIGVKDTAVPYKKDMFFVATNSKIGQMSKRRRKIALKKQKTFVATNCYPTSVGGFNEVSSKLTSFSVTFSTEFETKEKETCLNTHA